MEIPSDSSLRTSQKLLLEVHICYIIFQTKFNFKQINMKTILYCQKIQIMRKPEKWMLGNIR